MADDLLYVYSSPGPVNLTEFTDWYDNEHVPNRLATPGFGAVARFRATDGLKPEWLATYEIKPGTLETPAYKALWADASEREKRIMASVGTLDRRVYTLLSDAWADGYTEASGAAPVVLAVSMSVPPEVVPDMVAYYEQEHYPMLLAVPGWRRARRFALTAGTAPKYLSLHEVESEAVFDEPGYQAAISTPWRNRIVAAATGREKRVLGLHKSFA